MRSIALFVFILAQTMTPQEWFQQGVKKHDAGDYAGAVAAFEKAEELKYAAPILLPMRMARAYARVGQRDKAFERLKVAIDRGYAASEQLNAENDFLSLRDDPRWRDLFATVQVQTPKKLTKEQRHLLEQLSKALPSEQFEPRPHGEEQDERNLFDRVKDMFG